MTEKVRMKNKNRPNDSRKDRYDDEMPIIPVWGGMGIRLDKLPILVAVIGGAFTVFIIFMTLLNTFGPTAFDVVSIKIEPDQVDTAYYETMPEKVQKAESYPVGVTEEMLTRRAFDALVLGASAMYNPPKVEILSEAFEESTLREYMGAYPFLSVGKDALPDRFRLRGESYPLVKVRIIK